MFKLAAGCPARTTRCDFNPELPILRNLRFDQPISPIPAAIKDINSIRIDIVEYKKILMTEQAHLFQRFDLIHWNQHKLLAADNDGRHFTRFFVNKFAKIRLKASPLLRSSRLHGRDNVCLYSVLSASAFYRVLCQMLRKYPPSAPPIVK